jgi:hypothetical protein
MDALQESKIARRGVRYMGSKGCRVFALWRNQWEIAAELLKAEAEAEEV